MADRISALPNSLISHILSFLPTDQAVATSILSKRWESIWLEVSTLNFEDQRYSRNKHMYYRFIQLVYAVMLSRGEERIIKKFQLNCQSYSTCDASSVSIWVRAATRCKVETLCISLPLCIKLSFNLFNSSNLVVLKLSGFGVKRNNNNDSSVRFPSLKVLDLRMLRFEEQRYLYEIISACPILEVLVMKSLTFCIRFYLSHAQTEHFLAKLVKADVSNSKTGLPLKSFYNVEFLRIDVMMPEKFPTHNFVNLTYMELSFWGYNWDWLTELLCYCPNLTSLVIEENGFGMLGSRVKKNWVHPQCVPKCLLSQLKAFRVKNYEGKEIELQLIKYIMQNARVLHDVTVQVCCDDSLYPENARLHMLQKLSLCRRGSDLCQLHFE